MLGHWFIYAIVMTSLIAVAAAAMEHLVAIWRMPRRVVWTLALGTAIAAPVIAGVRVQPRATPDASSAAIAPIETRPAVLPAVTGSANTAYRGATSTSSSSSRIATSAIEPLLTPLWFAASATLGLFLFAALVRLRRHKHGWREARLDGVDLLIAPDAGPAVVGFVRPRIVVPQWIMSLDAPGRALILRHELEHVRARDPYLLLFAILSTIAVPWNVAVWYVARRLTLAVELDCDQRVLQATGGVREYGLVLLEVARRRSVGGVLLGASLVQPRRFLARRIRSMVAGRGRRPRLTSLALAASATILALAATRLPAPELPTHRWTGPRPRISANWENAPIELVVAAFARFSGRRIDLAPDVVGSVTARVNDEPWDDALTHIMGANGLRVVVHADSSITIVVPRSTPARPTQSSANRPVIGRAIDASHLRNAPLVARSVGRRSR